MLSTHHEYELDPLGDTNIGIQYPRAECWYHCKVLAEFIIEGSVGLRCLMEGNILAIQLELISC